VFVPQVEQAGCSYEACVTTCEVQVEQLEQPALQVLQGDAHAVVQTGRIVTCWTPHVLQPLGAYPAVQLWHVEPEAGAA
jgi:hypothetical protein